MHCLCVSPASGKVPSSAPSRRPNTTPSSSELLARRLAPCTPLQATSPTACRPGNEVLPSASTAIPPMWKCAAGVTGIGCRRGSMPCAMQAWNTVGNRGRKSAPRWRASSHAPPSSPACQTRRATMSRGARSASGCTPSISGRASASSRRAPAPRSASVTSGRLCRPGTANAVGWNCTNSRSRMRAPAAKASASPLPSASTGLLVRANRPPMPPVASTTARPCTRPRRPSASTNSTPQTRSSCSSRPSTSTPMRRRTWPLVRAAAISAAITFAPLASPPACTMRGQSCPPSSPSCNRPSASRSNITPCCCNHATASAAALVSTSTIRASL